jgi:hypothetical protein
VAAVAACVGMNIGMNLDTVIVKADRIENGQVETLRVETHTGEVRFVFSSPAQAVSPISLLGKRLVEMVIDLHGPRTVWHLKQLTKERDIFSCRLFLGFGELRVEGKLGAP